MVVFRDFLGNGSNDFHKKLQNGRGDQYEAFAKNRMSKFCSVLEIFIHKVEIFAENGQSGVQRSLYISRTVNATENLIRYSESTENFFSRMSHQIFAYLSSLGRKFGPKIGNFPKIFKILQNFAFFEKKNFFSKFLNGLIRKVSMLKSIFDDIFVPAPL